MQTLAFHVKDIEAGEPLAHANLLLVPLRGPRQGRLEYRLAAEALEVGTLKVTEASEGGRVPELRAASTDAGLILLLDGEELVGAKQNRILNTSVLLPPKSETLIPVSCVEAGRWRYVAPEFQAGGMSPSHLRARKSRDVGVNLRARGRAESDQGAVWDEVAEHLADLGTASPTMAMRDAVVERGDSIADTLAALPLPEGARGVFVAINDRFVAVDLLDRAETLARLWPRLVTGYAMDALARLGRKEPGLAPTGPQAILERLGQIPCERHASAGVGEDWRFEAEDLVGQALVAEGVCVHLSVFPNEAAFGRDAAAGPEPHLEPPSRRRRRGGGSGRRTSRTEDGPS
ncbi:MAG: hypothetical protein IMZ66_02560 [Planctomycetes bacterium]|nr:hypothetical protein [Planctomycetota bacterium]